MGDYCASASIIISKISLICNPLVTSLVCPNCPLYFELSDD